MDLCNLSKRERKESHLKGRATPMFLKFSCSRLLLMQLKVESAITMSNHLNKVGSIMLTTLQKKRDLQVS